MARGPALVGGNADTMPPATKESLGGVIVGKNLTVSEVGEIDVPAAAKDTLGVIKIGDGMVVDADGKTTFDG